MDQIKSAINDDVNVEILHACPVCESQSISSWCDGYDRLHEKLTEQFAYSKCISCGVVFESVRPLEDEVYKAYPIEYGPYQAKKSAPKKKRTINNAFNSLAAHIVGHKASLNMTDQIFADLSKGDVVLDFGCGVGKFLNTMAKRKCRTIGIDFSPKAIDAVLSNGHEGFKVGEGVWDNIEDNSVDFIRMNHVVEHLYRPHAVLSKLFSKLKVGGCVHIAVPNPAGYTARMFRSMWYGLDCPRHVILYPPSALNKMLYDIGYRNINTYPEPLTKDHVRSWGYLIHKIGLLPHHKIHGLIYVGILQVVIAIPCRIASWLGMADRYHIEAHKPPA